MKERAVGVLYIGMFIRLVTVWLNIHHSTKARLRERFQQTGRAAERPQWRCPRTATPAQKSLRPTVSLE
jgi:transposase